MSRQLHSKSVKASGPKVLFEPLAELRTEGMALEILVKGLVFLDVQFGMTTAMVGGVGECLCGATTPRASKVGSYFQQYASIISDYANMRVYISCRL